MKFTIEDFVALADSNPKAGFVTNTPEYKRIRESILSMDSEVKPSPFDLLVITTAYEQGYGKGLYEKVKFNPYGPVDGPGPASKAWEIGFAEGQSKAKQTAKKE